MPIKLPEMTPDTIVIFTAGAAGFGVYRLDSLTRRVRGTTFTTYATARGFANLESARLGETIVDLTIEAER